MSQRDIGGYPAMIFKFAEDSNASFYMKNVPVPMAVAWFDAAGNFVSSAEMELCQDAANCQLYNAAGPFRTAVETHAGGLGSLGITGGSSIQLDSGSCT